MFVRNVKGNIGVRREPAVPQCLIDSRYLNGMSRLYLEGDHVKTHSRQKAVPRVHDHSNIRACEGTACFFIIGCNMDDRVLTIPIVDPMAFKHPGNRLVEMALARMLRVCRRVYLAPARGSAGY